MKIHKARDDYLSPTTWQFIFNGHFITLACMTDHSYHTCPIFFFFLWGGGRGVIKRKEFLFSGLSPEFLSTSRSTRTYTVSQFSLTLRRNDQKMLTMRLIVNVAPNCTGESRLFCSGCKGSTSGRPKPFRKLNLKKKL